MSVHAWRPAQVGPFYLAASWPRLIEQSAELCLCALVMHSKGLVGTAPGGGHALGVVGLMHVMVSRCCATVDLEKSKSTWKPKS